MLIQHAELAPVCIVLGDSPLAAHSNKRPGPWKAKLPLCMNIFETFWLGEDCGLLVAAAAAASSINTFKQTLFIT